MIKESSNEFFDLTELRKQWEALATADTLQMMSPEVLIASIHDLANELLQRTSTDMTKVANELANAIRLTVEYVGNDMLPAREGYSWFDALDRWYPEMVQPFIDKPIHFAPNSRRWNEEPIINLDNDPNKEEMFINSRTLDCRDALHPVLNVFSCSRCGSVVSNINKHKEFHTQHGHTGFSFQ